MTGQPARELERSRPSGIGESVRKAVRLIEKDRRKAWIGLVSLAIGVSVLEGFSALLVFSVLNLTTDPTGALDLPLIGDVRRFLPGTSDKEVFVALAAGTALVFGVRSAALVFQSYVQNRVAWDAGVRLSERLSRGYLGMPYEFHLQRNSSELIRNSYETVNDIVSQVFIPSVLMTSEALVTTALLVILMLMAPVPTAVALLSFGGLIYVLVKTIQPRLERYGELGQVASARTLMALQQGFHGIREIKALGRELYFQSVFLKRRRDTADAKIGHAVLLDLPRIALETSVVMVLVGLLALTVGRGGQIEEALSVLGLFAYAVLRMMPSANRLLTAANNMRFGVAALDIVTDELRRLHDAPLKDPLDSVRGVGETPLFKGTIDVGSVSFRYESSAELAVEDVTLQIKHGESVGLVGPTGGGKSTLIDLIIGLLEPSSGIIRVDGRDLRGCQEEWRSAVGVVHQSIFLVDDTLRRNVALGVADDEIDEEALREAVRLAHLREFVAGLPEGLETVVGERGVRLSGGQRQRVGIARALYRRPSLLVFDEGTSALDNVTEAAIIDALTEMRGQRTIITVAHRLSTVKECDWIAVMEAGRVTAAGPFEDLLTRSPSFRAMVR